MNHKIGRNDACTCGSGRKYKKCCMEIEKSFVTNAAPVDFQWLQLRQLEGTIVDQYLLPYATQELPEDIMHCALANFILEDLPESLDKHVLFQYFFLPWFLFNWIPADKFGLKHFNAQKTVAQNYMSVHKERLNSQEKRFIETMSQSYYSFYSVLDVEIEQSLLVKDILLGTTHTIKERQGTHQLKRGDIVLSRILTFDNTSIFIGMAPFVIPARYNTILIDFRKWLIEENNGEVLSAKVLRDEFDGVVLDYFFDIMKILFDNSLPILSNTDGELIQFTKSYFKLEIAPEEALNQLLPLTLEENVDEFLQEAKKDKSGKIKQIEFPWLKKGNKKIKSWDNTVLGHITLEQGRLILEANSQERTQRGKKLLNKYLGKTVLFQKTLIETPEQKVKASPNSKSKKDKESSILRESPEVQEQLKSMAQAHWENWFDESIPALKNKTPREATKTKNGRERLEALLLEYENYDLKQADNIFKADIPYLRKELGLDA